MKTNHDSTELQLVASADYDITQIYYVETVDAVYRGKTLNEAMRVWQGWSQADTTEVVNVGRIG